MTKNEETKVYNYEFDFSLKINENILVYREFNVKGYNDDFRESLEAKELADEIMGNKYSFIEGILPGVIKSSSMDLLWDGFNPNKAQTLKESTSTDDQTRPNRFSFEIRKKQGNGKEVILTSIFDANDFQGKLRIDLKDNLGKIKDLIKDYMSKGKYTKSYLGSPLKRANKITKRELNECK